MCDILDYFWSLIFDFDFTVLMNVNIYITPLQYEEMTHRDMRFSVLGDITIQSLIDDQIFSLIFSHC